jgi:hypothetical protein
LKLMALHRQVFRPAHDPVPVVRIDFLNGLPLRFGKIERFDGGTPPAFRARSPPRASARPLAKNN